MRLKKKIHIHPALLAVILFLLFSLPFLGFYFGLLYTKQYNGVQSNVGVEPTVYFSSKCEKYGMSLKENITPPPNFPGYDKSTLIELSAEITAISQGRWDLKTNNSSAMFIPDQNTIFNGKKHYVVGDCVTVQYGYTEGRFVYYQVSPQ